MMKQQQEPQGKQGGQKPGAGKGGKKDAQGKGPKKTGAFPWLLCMETKLPDFIVMVTSVYTYSMWHSVVREIIIQCC